METKRYPASVFWSDEDEGYIAIASDLDGCSAFGDTAEEALSELQNAISAWIEAVTEAGNPVPRPSNPAVDQAYSGKMLLRMPKWLHRQLALSAERNSVSLNQHVVTLLTWNEALDWSNPGAGVGRDIIHQSIHNVGPVSRTTVAIALQTALTETPYREATGINFGVGSTIPYQRAISYITSVADAPTQIFEFPANKSVSSKTYPKTFGSTTRQ